MNSTTGRNACLAAIGLPEISYFHHCLVVNRYHGNLLNYLNVKSVIGISAMSDYYLSDCVGPVITTITTAQLRTVDLIAHLNLALAVVGICCGDAMSLMVMQNILSYPILPKCKANAEVGYRHATISHIRYQVREPLY